MLPIPRDCPFMIALSVFYVYVFNRLMNVPIKKAQLYNQLLEEGTSVIITLCCVSSLCSMYYHLYVMLSRIRSHIYVEYLVSKKPEKSRYKQK